LNLKKFNKWVTLKKNHFLFYYYTPKSHLEATKKAIEYKIETIRPTSKIKQTIKALKQAHPYEYPAFGATNLAEF
jgi:uncharacterized protein involved in tolerance to divalent cations